MLQLPPRKRTQSPFEPKLLRRGAQKQEWQSPLRLLSYRYICGELLRLAARNGQGLPSTGRLGGPMLRQVNDLPHVIRVVSDLAVDGLHHGVRLGANRDRSNQILIAQWSK